MLHAALKELKHDVVRKWPGRLLAAAASVAVILNLEVLLFWNCTKEIGVVWEALQFALRCCSDFFPVDLRAVGDYPSELHCNLERARIIFIINAILGSSSVLLMILLLVLLGLEPPHRAPTEGQAVANVITWFFGAGWLIVFGFLVFLMYMTHLQGRWIPRVTEYRWTALVDLVLAGWFFIFAMCAVIFIYKVVNRPELHRPEDML